MTGPESIIWSCSSSPWDSSLPLGFRPEMTDADLIRTNEENVDLYTWLYQMRLRLVHVLRHHGWIEWSVCTFSELEVARWFSYGYEVYRIVLDWRSGGLVFGRHWVETCLSRPCFVSCRARILQGIGIVSITHLIVQYSCFRVYFLSSWFLSELPRS